MKNNDEIFDNLDSEELSMFKKHNLSNHSMSIAKKVMDKCDYDKLVRILTSDKDKESHKVKISYNKFLEKWQLYSIDKTGLKTFIMLCDTVEVDHMWNNN